MRLHRPVCVAAIGGGGRYEDLWHSPVGGERQTVNRQNDQGREQTASEREETTQSGENLTLLSTHISQDLYCDMNQSRIQSDQRINRQPFPSPDVTLTQTLNPRLKPNQAHASTDVWAKQRMGRVDMSKQMYSSTEKTAPPTEDKRLSVKMRAPPPVTNASSLCDERQNELHYYIAKVFVHTDTHTSLYYWMQHYAA